MKIKIESLNYIDRDYKDDLLEHLCEKVFHITTIEAYGSILREGFIYTNQTGKYPINTGSEKSVGRYRGWVCLFDLRGKTDKEIDKALSCYYFLGPQWFEQYSPDYTELNLVYLILSPSCYQRLIPNESANTCWNDGSGYTQYIPRVECWFSENLPIDYIERVLHVRIRKQVQKDNSFLYAHHMTALHEKEGNMKNLCSMFEISVEDFDRAKKFYESIFGIEITEMNVLDTPIGMFPMEGYFNMGCISKCIQHRPSKDGTLIYLNADNDIEGMLEKIKSAGGEILTPKTKLGDQFGFMAVFLDTEGNRIALHAQK